MLRTIFLATLALSLSGPLVSFQAKAAESQAPPAAIAAPPAAKVTLDDNNPKQTITVASGSAVTVELKTTPMQDYHWEVQWIDGPCKTGDDECWNRYYHPIKPIFSAALNYAVATVIAPSKMHVVFGYFPPLPTGGTGATATKVFEVTVETK